MKKLPIGIQGIREIVQENYVYVDKTGYAERIIAQSKHNFISRPRRFGKSLFLDTLREIFKGNKELFEGCAICKSDYDWKEYPIVYLDFAGVANSTPKQLEAALKTRLEIIGQEHGISIIKEDVKIALDTLVVGLSNKYKNRVVVLVDEYDKPLIDHLKDPDVADENRRILQGFFETFKPLDQHLRFTFVTGISKFAQVSLFSSFNNQRDLTMNPAFADMMGYTKKELKTYFALHVQAIAEERSKQFRKEVTEEDILEEMREWYNGYRFSEKDVRVYNPFSTLNFLQDKRIKGYWYSTGTPTFLLDQARKQPTSVASFNGIETSERRLIDITHLNLNIGAFPALMFQTGYLTVESYNQEKDFYRLGFPNREVREAFYGSLIEQFGIDARDVTRAAEPLREALTTYHLENFVNIIKSHFAKLPSNMCAKLNEGNFQANLFLMLELSGIHSINEVATNVGRIDIVSEMPKAIYVFELKLDKSADQALNQAKKKGYKERYLNRGKEVVVMGINFSSKSRNITNWKGELFSETGEKIKNIVSLS